MLNQAYLFLFLLLGIGFLAKNQSLVVAVSVLVILKMAGADEKLFGIIQAKGINWGVTVITIAVLVPVASGHIGFKELGGAVKSPMHGLPWELEWPWRLLPSMALPCSLKIPTLQQLLFSERSWRFPCLRGLRSGR